MKASSLKKFHQYLALNRSINQYLQELGVSPQVIINLPNGVSSQEFKPIRTVAEKAAIRKHLDLPDVDYKILLFVGRLSKVKGLDILLSSYKLVEESGEKVCLVIVGDMNKKTSTMAWASSLDAAGVKAAEVGIKKIIFTGFKQNIAEYMKAADIFVFPSFNEGMSNALVEAMMSGLPIVASSISGNNEVVEDGINGFLFAAGDYKAMASGVIKLLQDKTICSRIAKSNRQKALKEFDIEKIAAQLYEVL